MASSSSTFIHLFTIKTKNCVVGEKEDHIHLSQNQLLEQFWPQVMEKFLAEVDQAMKKMPLKLLFEMLALKQLL